MERNLMTTSSKPKQRTPQQQSWGFCKRLNIVLESNTTSTQHPSCLLLLRGSPRADPTINTTTSSTNSSTVITVLLFKFTNIEQQQQQQRVVLCRYSGDLPDPQQQSSIFCIDDSIQIVATTTDVWIDNNPFITPLYHIDDIQKAADNNDDFDTVMCASTRADHWHVKVSSYKNVGSSPTTSKGMSSDEHSSIVYRLDNSRPCPLLSLFVKGRFIINNNNNKSSNQNHHYPHVPEQQQLQPLLWACVKRQLVGSIVMFDQLHQVTTQMCLTVFGATVQLQVTSVLPLQQQQQQQQQHAKTNKIFVVLPSTRITVLPEENEDSNNDHDAAIDARITKDASSSSSSLLLSAVARRMIDTIRCIRHHHDGNQVNLSRSLLLTGPPGVGKTHAVRIAFQYGQQHGPTRLWSIRGSELLAKDSDSDNDNNASRSLHETFDQAVQFTNTSRQHIALVFLDECDALLSSSSQPEDTDTTTSPAAATLAWLLDQVSNGNTAVGWQQVLVVAATNRLDVIPSFLRRPGRLDREMVLSPPSISERFALLQSLLPTDTNIDQDDNEVLQKRQLMRVAEACVGYVPADLVALVRRATFLALQEDEEGDAELSVVTSSHLMRAMVDVGASALRDAALSAPPQMGWDDVAGDPGGAKTALRQAVEWPRTRRAAFLRLGLTPPRGILLHGPPGCAKTSLARAAAGATGIAFLSYAPADVYSSSYVGEAEAVVRNAFTLARSAAPCILFFDEIDAILGSDSSSGGHSGGMNRRSSAEARVLSTFLNEMDGVDGSPEDGVLVLAATNRPWMLDAALLRPGRLEKIIFVPPPDLVGRKSILQMHCPKCTPDDDNKEESSIDLDYLASDEISGLMTGAEIVGACRNAAGQVLRCSVEHGTPPVITQKILELALRNVKPLLSNPATMKEYQTFWKRNKI